MKPAGRGSAAAMLLAVFTMGWPGLAAAQPPSPKETAEKFYRKYLSLGVSGLPTAKQLRALEPWLQPELAALIRDAQHRQARAIASHPAEKPPWAEGDLFSSLFEGAQAFEAQDAKPLKDRAAVPLKLRHSEGRQVTRWTDTIVLTQHQGAWLVSDILFQGKWAFRSGGSLRQVLRGPG